MQRLIERAWGLKPLSLRNSRNAAIWIPGLAVYGIVTGWVGTATGHGLLHALLLAVDASRSASASWSGPGGCSARAGSRRATCCRSRSSSPPASASTGSCRTSAIPRLFNTYAARYGVIGATFAIISALFGAMFVVVVMTAIGREITEELDRLRRGERPPPDAVRREWDALIADLRERHEELRRQRDEWRAERARKKAAKAKSKEAGGGPARGSPGAPAEEPEGPGRRIPRLSPEQRPVRVAIRSGCGVLHAGHGQRRAVVRMDRRERR